MKALRLKVQIINIALISSLEEEENDGSFRKASDRRRNVCPVSAQTGVTPAAPARASSECFTLGVCL